MANADVVDIGQLSETQQLALEQYTAVTNQDLAAAVPLLQRSQWNVQIAIAKFFDGEQPDPIEEARAAQNIPPPRPGRQENLQESLLASNPFGTAPRPRQRLDPAPRIVPQPEDQVIRRPPFILAVLFSPFRLLYQIFSTSVYLFSYLFPFLPRLLGPPAATGARRPRDTTGRRPLNPRDTAARFSREFNEEYGPSDLTFFDNGYAQALDLAKKDLKFLLVVLLSPEHDDTSSWVRDTLLSPEIVSFLKDPSNNIILWGGNVQDSEAYQVSTALRCSKFPFGALIVHTPRQGAATMSIVARMTGTMSASTYLAKLQAAVTQYNEELAGARAARQAQEAERGLRQEQDSAYERSLAQDRERKRKRLEEEARRAAEEEEALAEAARAEEHAQKAAQWRKWRAASILPEPAQSDKSSVRIALKMPGSGERQVRRFAGDAPIEELYAFVECHELLGDDMEKVEEPADFKHEYGFRIVSPMPRAVYALEEGGTIAERVGRSGNLIVEPILEDDEDVEG